MVSLLYSVEIGVVAGLIPVYLGLAAPLRFFRTLSTPSRNLLISVSIGILLFLFADVMNQGVELARSAGPGPFLFALGLTLGLAGPAAFPYRAKRNRLRRDTPAGELTIGEGKFFTAYMISLGIGLHNFGEGLALGAAYAAGQLALTTVLVIGFALHNGTEGMGIAGPISGIHIRLKEPLLLGFIAGFPTVLGSVIGSVAYSGLLGSLFFSAASGALLYVIVQLMRMFYSAKYTFVGIAVGVMLMYFTDLLLSL